MANHDYVIANGTGSSVRSDLNDALAAIVSNNSSSSEPATKYAYQWWADTSSGLLKQRNAANNAWVTIGTLASANLGLVPLNGAGGTPTSLTLTNATGLPVAGGGTGAATFAANGVLFGNGTSAVGVTAVGTATHVLTSNGAGNAPTFQAAASGVSDKISEGNTEAEVVDTGSDGHFKVTTEGTERLRIDSSGNAGIGTSSPSSYAAAARDLVIKNATNAGITIRSGSSSDGSIYFNDTDDGNQRGIIRFDHGTDALAFHTPAGESMRIDSSGRLLVGTSSSSQVNTAVFQGNSAAGSASAVVLASTINNPSSTQVIGKLAFSDNGHVEAASIKGSRDGGTWTSGSSHPSALRFETTADGSSSPTERMRIGTNGLVATHMSSTSGLILGTAGNATNYTIIKGKSSSTGINTGNDVFYVYGNGNVQNSNNSYSQISDVKLKENIVDANSQWNDLKAVQVRNFNFKAETGHSTHTQIGVVAQEIEVVSPGLVYETPDRDAEGEDLGTVTKAVSYSVLYMKAIKALQEAMTRIETLETKVAALEAG